MERHYLLIALSILLVVLGQSLGKMGVADVRLDSPHIGDFFNVYILAMLCMLSLRGLSWFFLFRKFDLSFVYPFLSLSYVAVLCVGVAVFGEALTLGRVAGSILIMAGVALVSVGERENRRLR